MNVPLFSDKEQAQFFKVIREINKHLHHTKQYDKAEEVIKQLNQFEKQIKAVASKVQKLFKKAFEVPMNKGDEKDREKNQKKCLKDCIDNYLRSRMPFEDQIDGIIQMWDRGKYTFYDQEDDGSYKYREGKPDDGKKIHKLKPDTILEENKELKKWVEDVFREVRNSRLKAIDIIKVIITKLLEIQKERESYQLLLNETSKERNATIYRKIKEVKKALFELEEHKIDDLFSEKTYNKKHLEYISDFIKAMNTLKVALNDLYIEKNKLRGFVPFYPAFRAELFKKRAEDVRKPLESERKVREKKFTNELENLEKRFRSCLNLVFFLFGSLFKALLGIAFVVNVKFDTQSCYFEEKRHIL